MKFLLVLSLLLQLNYSSKNTYKNDIYNDEENEFYLEEISLDESLRLAAWKGDESEVKRLIKKGADLNSPDDMQGWTPLHHSAAAIEGKLENQESVIKLLLKNGANINAKTMYGETPFELASLHQHLRICKILLNAGQDVNCVYKNGNTALHHAVVNKIESVVKLLLKKGAKHNAQNDFGETPFELASYHQYSHICEILQEKTLELNESLNCAVWNCNRKEMERLIEKGADVNSEDKLGQTPLHVAAIKAIESIVRFLLKKGANINARTKFIYGGQTPFELAAFYEKSHICKILSQIKELSQTN